MSHQLNWVQRGKLILHVCVWSVVSVVAGVWLTTYLVGTLEDPLKKRAALSQRADVFDSVVSLTEKKVVRHLGEWEFLEPKIPGHFHHVGRWYQADQSTFCITCHGPTPHARSPQQRAFLNMHTLFISCQVCHVPEEDGLPLTQFGWMDIETGTLCPTPEMNGGAWGEYGAKIVPVTGLDETPRVRHLTEEEEFAAKFRERLDDLDDRQKVVGNKFIHKRCQDEPIRCSACHTTKAAFLPYTALGYSRERADFLRSAEVVDLVSRYETFHMTDVLRINGEEKRGEPNE